MKFQFTLGVAFLVLTMGASADPLLTSGSLTQDPFDQIVISDDSVRLGGDAAGSLSDIIFNQGIVTFTYTLAKNPADHGHDGKWNQDYDFYTPLLDPSDPSHVESIFHIHTVGGTGDAFVTYTHGDALDLTGSQPTGIDPVETEGLHTLATFTPGPSGGDIGGEFDVLVPEPSVFGGLGIALAGIVITLRRRRTQE